MKKLIFSFILLFLFNFSYSWNFPLHRVSKPIASCKFNHWDKIPLSCKIKLPLLKPSLYSRYKNDYKFYRRIYTILWASSYKYGWDVGNGTHLGVDIATSLWTPVYSIWKGRVVWVWYKKGRWKTVVIQHKINGKYIYSNYAHLSKILVKFNQKVNESTLIWKVGHTWNAYWNHLHFQIDKNQSISKHPFRFRKCSYGHSIFDVVNHTFCLPEVKSNTLDPLAFLASNGAIVKSSIPKIKKIDRKQIKYTYEDIQKKILNEFLVSHKFSFYFPDNWVYTLWKYGFFNVYLKDRRWRKFKDILPSDLEILYDKSFFYSVSPIGLKVIDGQRKITFLPRKTWITFFTIKLWNKVIYTKTIRILRKWDFIHPKKWKIIVYPNHNYIWNPAWWINIFQDKNYINMINVPFPGFYYVSSKNNNLKFCKINFNKKSINYSSCNAYNMSNKLRFSYSDTYKWLFIFNFFSNSWKKDQIIIKNKYGKILSKSKTIYFKNIKLVSQNSIYKYDVFDACKKWLCLNLTNKWYLWNNKNLSKYYLKKIIENILLYKWKSKVFKIHKNDKKEYISRLVFIKYVLKYLWIKVKNYKKYHLNYVDTKKLNQNDVKYIVYLTKLWFRWKDRFARYHFQANKTISIEEALYFVNFILTR